MGNRFALGRDRSARLHADQTAREGRKRDLLEILRKWEQKFVVVTDPDKIGHLYYSEGIQEIAAATERFRQDVTDKSKFDELNVISGMNPQTMDANGKHQRRETICGAVRNLIAFVREV